MKPQKTITLKQWLVMYSNKGGKSTLKNVLQVFGKYPRLIKYKTKRRRISSLEVAIRPVFDYQLFVK